MRRTIPGMIVVSLLTALGAPASAQEAGKPPANALTDAERKALHAEAGLLRDRLAAVRQQQMLKPDHWADAQLFVKGVLWALDFEAVLDGKNRELLFIDDFDAGDESGPPGRNVNYIELHPMGRLGENAYRFEGETDVDEAIEAVCRNYPIDRRRMALRGSSLGGVGTWQLGLKRPDRFVALGPTALYPNPLPGAAGRYVVLNSGHTNHDKELRFSYIEFPRLGDWAVLKVGESAGNGLSAQVGETVLRSCFFDEAWAYTR